MSVCLCLLTDSTSSVKLFVLGPAIQGKPSICHPDFWYCLLDLFISVLLKQHILHTRSLCFDQHLSKQNTKNRYGFWQPNYWVHFKLSWNKTFVWEVLLDLLAVSVHGHTVLWLHNLLATPYMGASSPFISACQCQPSCIWFATHFHSPALLRPLVRS